MMNNRLKPYERIKRDFGEYFEAVEGLGKASRSAGPLDEATVQLVQLAASAAQRSEGAVHSHARRALEAGVRPEALRHTVLALTSTIGFPQVVAALSWVDDIIDGTEETS